MSIRWLALTLAVALGVVPLFGQTNQAIDNLIAADTTTYGMAAYFCLVGGQWLEETASQEEAFALAQEKGWADKGAEASSPINLTNISLLIMKSLKLQGGIGWQLLGGKRYAYKELVFMEAVNTSGGDQRVPSGEEFLRILAKALEFRRS